MTELGVALLPSRLLQADAERGDAGVTADADVRERGQGWARGCRGITH